MTPPNPDARLRELLTAALKKTRDYLANSRRVVELMQPEMARFEAREGHNVYATRLAVDHISAIRTDEKDEWMLVNAIALLDRIEALEAGLRPFADAGEYLDLETDGFLGDDRVSLYFEDHELFDALKFRDFINAYKALAERGL